MDDKTVQFYADNAHELSVRYNRIKENAVSAYFSRAFPKRGSILEIGSGSGRDLYGMLINGYDVYGIDASEAMVDAALKCFPALKGRLKCASIPSSDLFYGMCFDGILCSAMIMHIPDELLLDAMCSIQRNLKKGGRLLISFPLRRPDLVEENRTSDGRLFILRSPERYNVLLTNLGFTLQYEEEKDDALGREGYLWGIQVYSLAS